MDEFLKWFTPGLIIVGLIAFFIRGDERGKSAATSIEKVVIRFEKWMDDHTKEHVTIGETLVEHTADIKHNAKDTREAHDRTNRRVDELRNDMVILTRREAPDRRGE